MQLLPQLPGESSLNLCIPVRTDHSGTSFCCKNRKFPSTLDARLGGEKAIYLQANEHALRQQKSSINSDTSYYPSIT